MQRLLSALTADRAPRSRQFCPTEVLLALLGRPVSASTVSRPGRRGGGLPQTPARQPLQGAHAQRGAGADPRLEPALGIRVSARRLWALFPAQRAWKRTGPSAAEARLVDQLASETGIYKPARTRQHHDWSGISLSHP